MTTEDRESAYRQYAIDQMASEDCQISDDAPVAVSADGKGAWIEAWLWIPSEEIDVEPPCVACGGTCVSSRGTPCVPCSSRKRGAACP